MVHNFTKPQPILIKFHFLESALKVLSAYEVWEKSEMVGWLFQFFWIIWQRMTHMGKEIFCPNLFLGCNFWTRNIRKSIKGSKGLDHNLVSNKHLSLVYKWPIIVEAQGLITSPKMHKPTLIMNYISQNTHKKTKSKTFQFKKI